MKSGFYPRGFTLVEVMIFLAVSGALMLSALTLLSGTQNKTQFREAANEALQQIDSVINNVSNGYYAGDDNITSCSSGGGNHLSISVGASGSASRGTSLTCEFIGRVIEFKEKDSFTIYDVAGARKTSTDTDVIKMSDAKPTIIGGNKQVVDLRNGLEFPIGTGLKNGSGTPQTAIGFFSTLGTPSGTNPDQLDSGTQQSDFVPINEPTLTLDQLIGGTYYETNKNYSSGMTICFNSGTTDQHATITVGGNRRSATTSMAIDPGKCAP